VQLAAAGLWLGERHLMAQSLEHGHHCPTGVGVQGIVDAGNKQCNPHVDSSFPPSAGLT
jgi:hypothetical protein